MDPIDPRWPKVLSLSVHEFRTPITVVSGYIRMLLKEQAGALNDKQRHLLTEAEKSCGRLSALVAEVSELSTLERGGVTFNKTRTDLHKILSQVVEQLPPLPDRDVPVHLEMNGEPALVEGDPVRLTQALSSIIGALRRELIGDEGLTIREKQTDAAVELLMGDSATIASMESGPGKDARDVFDEWRGGVGLSLAVARRILNAHNTSIYAPPEGQKAGARVVISKT